MAKMMMLGNHFFKGAKSGKLFQTTKGDLVDEDELKHLVKGEDYDSPANVEDKAPAKKK